MADILKVPGELIVSNMNKWKNGELPDANKFQALFGAFQASLSTIAQIIGPVLNTNPLVSSKDKIISSGSFYGEMTDSDRANWALTLSDQIVNTFNIARIIGPHGVLNPQYLPGSLHSKSTLGTGYQIATNSKVQQLPFPPTTPYTATITGETGWSLASSAEEVMEATSKKYYIDSTGVLYLSREMGANAVLKYDLYVPNTYSYLGSGYNCIPDLSILSLSEESRTDVLDGDYGLVKVEFQESSADSSTWKITLPKIISVRDPLFSYNDKQIANPSYEPVGIYESATNSRWYTLNWSELYNSEIFDRNTLALFNKETNETFILEWQVDPDETNAVQRTYLASGPGSLVNKFYQNDHTTLLYNGGSNSRDFFVFAINSTITEQLAQVSLNYSKHKHTGIDSYRISHKDLLNAEGNVQGLGGQEGEDGGLDFRNYSRQLAYSNVKDNPHAQYLNRLGFLHGGSHGLYEAIGTFTKTLDLNMMHGDFLFYPIESINSGTKPYKYASSVAYAAAALAGDDEEKIYWDLVTNVEDGIASDIATTFPDYRTHAMIFGWPEVFDHVTGDPYNSYKLGATKLYYEPWNFLSDTEYDNKGNLWTLKDHGFIPGDFTGLTGVAKRRGLSINWGNLFFGHREDIFGGLLLGETNTEASASFRTSEFNVVTTANGQAGLNTNSVIKNGYAYRDGFAVRSLKGSNIWLSVGGEYQGLDSRSVDNNPGSFALDVSLASSSDEDDANPKAIRTLRDYRNRAAGAGILATPSLREDGRIPWVKFDNDLQSIASLWDNDEIAATASNTYTQNSVLDIFNLAVDYQTTNDLFDYIAPGSDSSFRGWIAGRPFMRGTYGINFCVSNNLSNLNGYFKTGYHKQVLSQAWGPEQALLFSTEDTDHEYIHREFRFWGSNESISPSPNTNSLDNTVGGNINLLYNFGRDYKRFGLTQSWNSTQGSLSGGRTTYSAWANARSISLGTSTPENYGSAIRQASFVDAFAGMRNDPLQPYIAEYVLPFVSTINLGETSDYSSGIDIANEIKAVNFIIGSKLSGALYTPLASGESLVVNTTDIVHYKRASTDFMFEDIRLDGLIRGSEEILISNSNEVSATNNKRFPASLIDYSLKLQYFMGKLKAGGDSSGDSGSPHQGSQYYKKVINNTVDMVPAHESLMGTPGTGNRVPIIMTDKNNKNFIATDYNLNAIVSYNSAIGVWPAGAGSNLTAYKNKFPLFEEKYGNKMDNKMFIILLNIDDRTTEDGAINSPVPYRIYVDGTDVMLEFSGTINLKMMTSYHKNPEY